MRYVPYFKEKLPLFDTIFEGEVSPALGVHTGPGLDWNWE